MKKYSPFCTITFFPFPRSPVAKDDQRDQADDTTAPEAYVKGSGAGVTLRAARPKAKRLSPGPDRRS